ncbi:MAG: hypothetical protein RL320_1809 [Pseudomonadota bacterium]|jgi:uncharacterized protein (DUF58 family)
MTPHEYAEAILIVIKKVFQWLVTAMVAMVLLLALLVGLVFAKDWYFQGRHLAKVQVEVSLSTALCKEDHPLFIRITNGSERTIRSTSLQVDVTKQGYSTKINDEARYVSDKVLKPGETTGSCWKVPAKNAFSLREQDQYIGPEGHVAQLHDVTALFQD